MVSVVLAPLLEIRTYANFSSKEKLIHKLLVIFTKHLSEGCRVASSFAVSCASSSAMVLLGWSTAAWSFFLSEFASRI